MTQKKPIYILLGLIIAAAIVLWYRGAGKNPPSTSRLPRSVPQASHIAQPLRENAATGTPIMALESVRTQNIEAVSSSVPLEPGGVVSNLSETNQLKVAGEEFSVLFESSDVSDSLRRAILSDIELNLSHFKHITLRSVINESEASGQGYRVEVTHVLDEGRQERLFPDVLEKYFGGAVTSGDTYQVVIHKDLIKAYEQAVEYRNAHPAMFQKLEVFLAQLRDQDYLARIENQNELAKRIIAFDDEPSSSYNYGREISGLLKHGDIRNPSLLDFQDVTYKEKAAVRFSTVIEWSKSMSSEPFTKGFPQFLYVDEEWRIYVPKMP